ncbi:MAG: hypothetical protein A2014_07785 [Spirochaetes bacterium GWF1_49_6]|nr:MAG: hypothetical protein A2014_07785 [Spirochaetes bacterium GWF1_49_6]
MGEEHGHGKVKLVLGVLSADPGIMQKMLGEMSAQYGEIDYRSADIAFHYTGYYDDEMGDGITRIFIAYKALIEPDELVEIKKFTNRLELRYAVDGKRKVNFDPGYLVLGKFLLATTKDQQHRIYIRDGIYEEVTLYYRDKEWRYFEWTYPDYRSDEYRAVFQEIRQIYKKQLSGTAKDLLQR